jgi:hypothetical protein
VLVFLWFVNLFADRSFRYFINVHSWFFYIPNKCELLVNIVDSWGIWSWILVV